MDASAHGSSPKQITPPLPLSIRPGAPRTTDRYHRHFKPIGVLDGGPNLGSIAPNHDKIYLPASIHPSATYRIIEVDAAGSRVRTEGRPALPASPSASPWRIAPYQEVSLLDVGGMAAAGVPGSPGVLQLDLDADLARVWPNETPLNVDEPRDTIYLEQDQGRHSKLYKIVGVDHLQKRVTVDAPPVLSASGRWRINHRPYLVMIDPFGARLQGEGATTQPANPDRVLLPGANLARVNAYFDTIYLASDTARPGRTYRILEVNDTADWVRIAHDPGNPVPSLGAGSRWYLQAGVGGVPAQVNYNLSSGRGFDHYDGMVFLVHNGVIHDVAAWTSYTSRNYSNYDEFRTSLRGNKDYEYSSYKSGKSFINFGLKVVDFGAGKRPGSAELFDGVREARWYYEPTTRDDTEAPSRAVGASNLGKTTIRFHYGDTGKPTSPSTASGSAGCMVSPSYDAMRGSLITIHNNERRAYDGTFDQGIDQLVAMGHRAAVRFHPNLGFGAWTDRLVGWVWVIRPGERSL
ncbi:MAG: hypothetical protein JNK64_08295 [Myxococcales bacterium]|nr:hypothetical protein [Myxococcales bacterium]